MMRVTVDWANELTCVECRMPMIEAPGEERGGGSLAGNSRAYRDIVWLCPKCGLRVMTGIVVLKPGSESQPKPMRLTWEQV